MHAHLHYSEFHAVAGGVVCSYDAVPRPEGALDPVLKKPRDVRGRNFHCDPHRVPRPEQIRQRIAEGSRQGLVHAQVRCDGGSRILSIKSRDQPDPRHEHGQRNPQSSHRSPGINHQTYGKNA